jgi:hypothetical protein
VDFPTLDKAQNVIGLNCVIRDVLVDKLSYIAQSLKCYGPQLCDQGFVKLTNNRSALFSARSNRKISLAFMKHTKIFLHIPPWKQKQIILSLLHTKLPYQLS